MRNFATFGNVLDAQTLAYAPPPVLDVGETIYLGLAFYHGEGSSPVATYLGPTGFTLTHIFPAEGSSDSTGLLVYTKVVTNPAAEIAGPDYVITITNGAPYSMAGVMWTHTGATDGTGGVTASFDDLASNSNTIISPSITTTVPNAIVVKINLQERNGTFTPPAGFTPIGQQLGGDPADPAKRVTVAASYIVQPVIGPTGVQTSTSTQSRPWNTIMFQIADTDVDNTAPVIGTPAAVDTAGTTSVTIDVTATDAIGSTYDFYVVAVPTGNGRPTDLEIIAGTGGGIVAGGSDLAVANGVEASVTVSPLATTTTYDFYTLVTDGVNHDSTAAPLTQATQTGFIFDVPLMNITGDTDLTGSVLLDLRDHVPGIVSSEISAGTLPPETVLINNTVVYQGATNAPGLETGIEFTAYDGAGLTGNSAVSNAIDIRISYPYQGSYLQNGVYKPLLGSPLDDLGVIGEEFDSFWVDPATYPPEITSVTHVGLGGAFLLISHPAATPAGTYFLPIQYFADSLPGPTTYNFPVVIDAPLEVTGAGLTGTTVAAQKGVAITALDVTSMFTGGAQPLDYTFIGNPSGSVLDIDTGLITGTPTESNVAPFVLEVTATDINGTARTASFSMQVAAETITATGPITPEAGKSVVEFTSLDANRFTGLPYVIGDFGEFTGDIQWNADGTITPTAPLPASGTLQVWASGTLSAEVPHTIPVDVTITVDAAISGVPTPAATTVVQTAASTSEPIFFHGVIVADGATAPSNADIISGTGLATGPDDSQGSGFQATIVFDTSGLAAGDYDAYMIPVAADGTEGIAQLVNLTVPAVNNPPSLDNPLADVALTNGTAFTLTPPANVYSDADAMTFSARLVGGAPISTVGLAFDGTSFSGTAPDDVSFDIEYVATDTALQETVDTFRLTMSAAANPPPTVISPVADILLTNGQALTFTPVGVFSDTDALVLTSRLVGGAALSTAGVAFDGASYSGTLADDTTTDFELIATDTGSQSVSDIFQVVMSAAPNQIPVLDNPIPDQIAQAGVPWSYQFPLNTFSDPDGDTLTYSSEVQGGAALSTVGLTFAPATRTTEAANPPVQSSTLEYQADDGRGGQVVDAVVVDFTLQAPNIIGALANISGSVGMPITPIDLANLFNGLPDQYNSIGAALPAGLALTGSVVSGVPTVEAATPGIQFEGRNASGGTPLPAITISIGAAATGGGSNGSILFNMFLGN